jgi:hypothetical protein
VDQNLLIGRFPIPELKNFAKVERNLSPEFPPKCGGKKITPPQDHNKVLY